MIVVIITILSAYVAGIVFWGLYLFNSHNTKENHKPDEERERVWYIFKKTTLRIRDGKDNPVYLIRYSLFTCPWFAIKLHKIMLSDDDCMHDHPWSFISIILRGGYVEHTPAAKRLYGAGSILYRPAPSVHKLEIFQPAITLVITFRRKREWGFYTFNGWTVWHRYIRSGQKCD